MDVFVPHVHRPGVEAEVDFGEVVVNLRGELVTCMLFVTLLGFDYRPVLAGLPDAKLWRVDRNADYAGLDKAARGQIDLDKSARRWPDILRIVSSIYTRTVSAHDVIRILQRDGRRPSSVRRSPYTGGSSRPCMYSTFVDDPAYRREMKRCVTSMRAATT